MITAPTDREIAIEALDHLSPHRVHDRIIWLRVGMILHSVSSDGEMLEAWKRWSSAYDGYSEAECEKQWRSFKPNGGLKIGTLLQMAKTDTGWQPDRAGTNGHDHDEKVKPTTQFFRTAEDAIANLENRIGKRSALYVYRSGTGDAVGYVVRIDKPDGKRVLPVSPRGPQWVHGAMGPPRAIYRLDELLASKRTVPVFVVEGEKCADAMHALGFVATTSSGGCNAANRSHWDDLAERDVVILPDHDDVGEAYAAEVARLIRAVNPMASIKIVRLPDLSKKEDVVDFIERRREDGKDGTAIVQEINDLVSAAEAPGPEAPEQPTKSDVPILEIVSAFELVQRHQKLREPIIDGIVRVGETMNIIAAPKVGKSFLADGMAICLAAGRQWLGNQTAAGEVLLIDNELHPETLAARLRRVAEAYSATDALSKIKVLSLRGKLQDLRSLGTFFGTLKPNQFKLVIVDAWYRTLPVGTDENDNGAIAGLYNVLDTYADHLGSAFALIHHSSKGIQAEKSITDVGSGAGSQSRAADTHLILRQHEEENVVVMDGVTRSFAPMEPKCLRWTYPYFTVAHGLDPTLLLSTSRRAKKTKPEPDAWDAQRFADNFGTMEPKTRATILAEASKAGLSDRKSEMLLKGAIDREYLFSWQLGGANKPSMISTEKPPKT